MGGRRHYQVPTGFIARGWRFEVETTTPWQRSLIQQHFGARRFAYNWALAKVRANLNARMVDPSVQPLAWACPLCAGAGIGPRRRSRRGGHREAALQGEHSAA